MWTNLICSTLRLGFLLCSLISSCDFVKTIGFRVHLTVSKMPFVSSQSSIATCIRKASFLGAGKV